MTQPQNRQTWYVSKNLCGQTVQQKLLIDGFRLENNKSKYTQKFNENYDDGSNNGYMLEVDASYAKRLH